MEKSNRLSELSLKGQVTTTQKHFSLLAGTALGLSVVLLIAIVWLFEPAQPVPASVVPYAIALVIVIVLANIASLLYHWWYIYRPDLALRMWVMRMCDGDFQIPLALEPSHPEYPRLAFHTGNLSLAFNQLTSEMEKLVNSQTAKLRRNNATLDTLYQVASAAMTETSTNRLLLQTAQLLGPHLNSLDYAIAKTPRSVDDRNEIDEQSSYEWIRRADDLTLHTELDQWLASLVNSEPHDRIISSILVLDTCDSPRLICLPIIYNDTLIAAIVFVTLNDDTIDSSESNKLLTAVAEQLSVSIVKSRYADEVTTLERLENRAEMANELHDSLAQTLTSSKLSFRLLEESLEQGDAEKIEKDKVRLKSVIDDANMELRSLIRDFRAPAEQASILPALHTLVNRFIDESGIQTLVQVDFKDCGLTAEDEIQVLRIVGEALANIKRHSDASHVRIMTKILGRGVCQLLIEDDGVGFDACATMNTEQQHFGLKVMHERALKIGGILRIESEAGEGTRLTLELDNFERTTADTS